MPAQRPHLVAPHTCSNNSASNCSASGRSFSLRAPLAVASLTALLAACGAEKPADTPAPAKPETVAAAPTVCKADPAWISSPTMPADVASTESFCDFYQFSWQWFLAQVAPAPDYATSNERVFETNRLHDPNVSSGQCSMQKIMGRAMAAQKLAMRADKPQDFEDLQADGNALYDQRGNILHYNIWYADAQCQSTQQGFAAGTFEIKISWKILDDPDPTYFQMSATLGGKPVTLGMVGFHIANWTPTHPEMIWATFEHKTNAPLCDGSSPLPPSGWAFASNDAANCLAQNKVAPGEPPSTACAQFNFDTPDPFQGNTPPATNTPNNVCRQFAYGNQPGKSINGNDNAANLAAIVELNAQLNGPDGLLTKLPDTDPMAIWKHYEMIGGIWTKGGANSGNPPVSYTVHGKDGDKIVPGDPTSLQRGSLELTNMTMETFQQGETSWAPNCFGCHMFDTTDPLDVSHICTSLFQTEPGTEFNCLIPATGSATPPAAPADAAAKPDAKSSGKQAGNESGGGKPAAAAGNGAGVGSVHGAHGHDAVAAMASARNAG